MTDGAPPAAEAPELRLFDPLDAGVRADPYPLYDWLRAAGRVYRSPSSTSRQATTRG